jgi:hypothetical protein
MASDTAHTPPATRHRPKSYTVFAAAFIAGAAAAVGINRVLDVQLAQRRPQVECEPIFVALRTLPQGAPVTVWDVALKDWPKAMLPTSALRAGDTFEGCFLRHAIREGQPLLSVQLVKSGATEAGSVAVESFTPAVPAGSAPSASTAPQADPWMPAESLGPPVSTPMATVSATTITEPAAVAQPATPRTSPTTSDIAAAVPAATPADIPAAAPVDGQAETSPAVAAAETTASIPAEEASAPAAATTEPTPAEQPAAAAAATAAEPMPPSPASLEPPAPPQPTVAGDEPGQMSEAVATDVQSMPSVMKAVGQPVASAASPARGDAGRYLVVPERIALQADTSFTTPRPQPPGPPAAAIQQPARPARPSAAAPQQAARRAAPPRPQTARGQQPQPTSSRRPAPPEKAAPPAGPREPKQAESTPRPWGGMFPNVAAGLEAMTGSWQRSRSAAQQAAPAGEPRRR